MQNSYTKEQFDEFIIQYIRESLKDKRLYEFVGNSIDEYNDNKWNYFLKILNSRGILGKLIALKSKDSLNITNDVKIHISKLNDNNVIQIRT